MNIHLNTKDMSSAQTLHRSSAQEFTQKKGTEFPYAVLILSVLIVGCIILEVQFQKF